ncbi:MAG: MptD family putative ECF transporter S component [Clostridiales bacterium]|nr:MptD family putative ECF transporter S component [Clostridiales bacterium]
MEKQKTKRYFTNKEIVHMAIMAAAMLIVSCITVPLVLGITFPGIRTISCGLFFGVIIALTYVRVPKFGAGTVTTLICSLPMVFFSPVILVFTVAAGFCTDIYFLIIGKKITVASTIGLGIVLMGTMMVFGTTMGIVCLHDTTFSALFSNPLALSTGFLGSAALGGIGSWLATRIFKEFKQLNVNE